MWSLILSFSPFFLLVALGSLAVRRGWVPLDGLGAMTAFVLYMALPAMLFRLGASGALYQPGLGGLLLAYAVAGSVVLALALAWAAERRLGRLDGGMAGLVTVFPNTGFLGIPLLTGLLGAQAAGVLAATIVVDVLVFSSVCLAWAHSQGRGPGDGAAQAAWHSLKGALRNPLLWSMGLGLLWGQTGWAVPGPVDETLRLLGLAATPAALFTLGGILVRPVRPDADAHGHRPLGAAPLMGPALLKLMVHPALVWGGAWALGGQGLAWSTLVMAAALPSASNVSMLAEREGVRTPAVARIILLTTALAVASLAFWAHQLGLTPKSPP
ncbi:MAG: hypothetical protein RI907_3091 [Pseudomonadota bacterium]|jgi:predicted permease